MLNRAHKFSFEDQRGPIDSKHLQIPDFLLSNSLIKSQSLNHSINTHAISSSRTEVTNHDSNKKYEKYKKPSLAAIFNESTASLPVMAATSPHTSSALTRSRSPILIIYDNEEEGEHHELNPYLNNESLNNNNNNNKAFRNSTNIDESCCIDNSIGIDRSLLSLNEEADQISNCASNTLNKSLQKSTSDTQIRPDLNESHKSSQLIMKTNSKNQISYV